MKKLFAILLVFASSVALLSAESFDMSADLGIGYMNYTIVTEFKDIAFNEKLKEEMTNATEKGMLIMENKKSNDVYNALAFGLAIKYSYMYANIAVGLPFKEVKSGSDPLGKKLKAYNPGNSIVGSFIVDGQIGSGITLFKTKPFNIFAGAAIGVNYIITKRKLPQAFVATIPSAKWLNEIRTSARLGLGLDLGINYYFKPNFGLCIDVKDTVYLISLLNQRYYRGEAVNGAKFEWYITQSKNINSIIKYSWSNNVTARLALCFRY